MEISASSHALEGEPPGPAFCTDEHIQVMTEAQPALTQPSAISCSQAGACPGQPAVVLAQAESGVCAPVDAQLPSRAEALRLCMVLDVLPANVALLDRNGQILSVNQGWRQFALENGANTLIAQGVDLNYLDVCRVAEQSGDTAAGLAADGIEAVLSGRRNQFTLEYPCDSPQETRWFSMKVTAFEEQTCAGAVVLHFDITAQRRVELETARRRDLLARESRLLSISELASSITHELTQPLTAMSFYCDALQTTMTPAESSLAQDLVARLHNQLGRAIDVVTHLRSFMRRLHPEVTSVSLQSLVSQASSLIETFAHDRKCRLEFDLAHELPPVAGDAAQLQQVLMNLLHNAVEASASVSGQSPWVQVRAVRLLDWVRISVMDNGPGLASAPAPDILKRMKADGAGTLSLGLSISQSIIKAHGGELWLETDSRAGSCIHFTLPVAGDTHEE